MALAQAGVCSVGQVLATSGWERRSKTCAMPRLRRASQSGWVRLVTSALRKRRPGRRGPEGVVRGWRAASRRLEMLGMV